MYISCIMYHVNIMANVMFCPKRMHHTWYKLIQWNTFKTSLSAITQMNAQSLSMTNTNHLSFHVQHECPLRSFSKQSLTSRFSSMVRKEWTQWNQWITWSCFVLNKCSFRWALFRMSFRCLRYVDFIIPAFRLGNSKPQFPKLSVTPANLMGPGNLFRCYVEIVEAYQHKRKSVSKALNTPW